MQLVDSKLYIANAPVFGSDRERFALGNAGSRFGSAGIRRGCEPCAAGDGSLHGFSFAPDFAASRPRRIHRVSNFWQVG
jgi:hypothetical protein